MKKIYLLPNFLTTANMFCGFYSIVASINGDYLIAAWMVLIAMAFDTLDGRIARLTRATSAFGVEYDSLSDLLSFGIAPAILVYLWSLRPFARLGWLAAFLYIVCTALRLARFNVRAQTVSRKYFQGAPSPLAAATLSTAVIFYSEMSQIVVGFSQKFSRDTFILSLTFLMASLMISTIPFHSFKEFKVKKENSFGILALGVLIFVLIAVKPEVTLFLICVSYIAIGLLLYLRSALSQKHGSHSHHSSEVKS